MTTPAPKLTLDTFWIQYAYKPYELLHGVVVPLKKLQFQDSVILLRLTALLEQYVVEHELGEVVSGNSGFALSADTIRSPRAAFVSQHKWETVRYPYRYYVFAPDIAIEHTEGDVQDIALRPMIIQYLNAGSQQVWVVSSSWQQIGVYVRGKYRVFGMEDVLLGGEAIAGLRVPVVSLFPRHKRP